jgi:hypothetical protein
MKVIASLGLVVVPLVATPAAAAASKPALRMLDRQPLVVRGEGFHAGERVRVTALTGIGPRFATVTAVGGRFRVTFRLPTTGCSAARGVIARGSDGSVATMALGGGVCVPPPRD